MRWPRRLLLLLLLLLLLVGRARLGGLARVRGGELLRAPQPCDTHGGQQVRGGAPRSRPERSRRSLEV